jgi:hypothetical protein
MAIVGNGVRLGLSNPMRIMGAPQAATVQRSGWGMGGALRNLWAGEATVIAGVSIANKSAYPDGYRHPYTWAMAPKAGGMAARFELVGTGEVSASIAGGVGIEAALDGTGAVVASLGALAGLIAALDGSGTLTADASGLVEIAAALVGSGAITADMGLLVGLVATLSGVGSLTGDMTGAAALTAALAGTGDLVPLLTATSDIIASLVGTSSMTATPSALGQMSATLTVAEAADPLSPSALAAAVWNALAASFNTAGTMGNKLNSASSAGDPWGTAIPGAYAAGSAGNVLGNLAATLTGEGLSTEQRTMLIELFTLAGLDPTKPLVVTQTTRAAGVDIEQTVVESPADTITVTRT